MVVLDQVGRIVRQDKCILFFAKYPKQGKVKTRLAKDIGNIHALHLYKCFILDLLARLEASPFPIIFCFHPPEMESQMTDLFGEKFLYIAQSGEDLGQRMENSFLAAFELGYDRAVVIGSDSPDLRIQIIQGAFEILEKKDAVIGPSLDGGYYLLGFSRKGFQEKVFHGIPWSTNRVFILTKDILTSHLSSFGLLESWYDIDTLEDLKFLYNNSLRNDFSSSCTINYIQEHMTDYFG